MAKFVYVYSGGGGADTPETQQESMRVWQAWFDTFGDGLVDLGHPFGASSTVTSGGTGDGGTSNLSGYSVVAAASLSEAADKAAGCPILKEGGTVEVYATIEM